MDNCGDYRRQNKKIIYKWWHRNDFDSRPTKSRNRLRCFGYILSRKNTEAVRLSN